MIYAYVNVLVPSVAIASQLPAMSWTLVGQEIRVKLGHIEGVPVTPQGKLSLPILTNLAVSGKSELQEAL